MEKLEITRNAQTDQFSVVLSRGNDTIRCMVTVETSRASSNEEKHRAALSKAKALAKALELGNRRHVIPNGAAAKSKSGLMQRNKKERYSTTSSAICWRCTGTSRPNALAVFILITSSNFVGCRTGKTEGLSPLRMRPA